MSDAEVPPSKKRVAGRQISKDCPESDDDAPEAEMGTFQKASEEVMAKRRIVKVRRNNPPSSSPSTNPFAAICLVPPQDTSAKASYPAEQPQTSETTALDQNDKTENTESPSRNKTGINELEYAVETEDEGRKVENVPQESLDKADDAIDEGQNDGEDIGREALKNIKKKDGETQKEAGEETTNEAVEANTKEENINDEKDLAPPTESVSSFGQLSGSKNAFTSLSGSGVSTSSFSFGSLPGDGFSFGKGDSSLFGHKNENVSFSFGACSATNGNSSLGFSNSVGATSTNKHTMQEVPIETGEENEKAVFSSDAIMYEYFGGGWKERGKGELKLNISLGVQKARLIMRAKAGESKDGLTTFALKFKDTSVVEEFRVALATHKGKDSTGNPLEGSDD